MDGLNITDRIFSAIADGNVEELQITLSAFRGNINALSKEDTSPLMWAVLHRKPQVVKVIVECDSDVNFGDNWETLHTAVCDRNSEIIQLLLEAGMNPNTRDTEGCHHTPLTRAVKLNDLDIVQLLVEAGCDLDLAGPAGESPLHIALKEGFHEAAVLLLTRGSNPAVEDDFNTNCLQRALRASHVISAELSELLIGQTERMRDGGRLEPAHCDRLFFMAIQGGHYEMVKKLLARGSADRINESNQFDQKFPLYYPLEMAVLSNSKDNPQIIKLLLDAGADPNQQGFTGLYPLHIAASSLNPDTLYMLIKAGAELDATTCGYYPTALMLAIKLYHDHSACLLVRHGARTDLCGQTAVALVHSQLMERDQNLQLSPDRVTLITLLHLSGSPCREIRNLLSQHLARESSSQTNDDCAQHVVELLSTLTELLTLKELARVTIRQEVGSGLLHNKDLLPLPWLLQHYLLMPGDS